MKATLTYEGKTVEVEIAEAEARKIFEKPKTGWEREFGGSYYSICDTGVLENLNDEGGRDDEVLYTCGNFFPISSSPPTKPEPSPCGCASSAGRRSTANR